MTYIDPLYRKPGSDELTGVAVDPEIREKFASVLSLPNTGIVRLLPDVGCETSSQVVSALKICLDRNIPGYGASYSFRRQTFSMMRLADIRYLNGDLVLPGELSQALFVKLSDVRIEEAAVSSGPIDALISAPAKPAVSDLARRLVYPDGRILGKTLITPQIGELYALRSVAFRGSVRRTLQGITYNELDYDKRRDITVVFKIVSIDPIKGVTLIWRQLQNKASTEAK